MAERQNAVDQEQGIMCIIERNENTLRHNFNEIEGQ
jgi:hypothetical protein